MLLLIYYRSNYYIKIVISKIQYLRRILILWIVAIGDTIHHKYIYAYYIDDTSLKVWLRANTIYYSLNPEVQTTYLSHNRVYLLFTHDLAIPTCSPFTNSLGKRTRATTLFIPKLCLIAETRRVYRRFLTHTIKKCLQIIK